MSFENIFIDSIIVDRPNRQRKTLQGIEELADSISRLGLINPITVDRDLNLIAGERRLSACKSLGWTHIVVQYFDELDELARHLIELEENTRRVDLTWQETADAMATYHKLRSELEPGWNADNTASALGTSATTVRRNLVLAQEIAKGNTLVTSAPNAVTATNIVSRQKARQATAQIDRMMKVSTEVPIINADLFEYFKTYDGPAFNFIHFDPPYGINFHLSAGLNKANTERYSDSPEDYKRMIEIGLPLIPKEESCHLMLWHSFQNYAYTCLTLRQQGWKVFTYPLIWQKSDNSGIMPDPRREGRRNYEVCIMASLGDRQLVQSVSNAYYGPMERDGHPSAKPRAMLSHFFRMFVDESTIMLDPTCGSGNAVRIAKDLHAASVLGLEIDNNFYLDAVNNWEKI